MSEIAFGKNGCSDIKVEPFQKICSYTKPEGSESMVLDVPAPIFVPPVPPNECACFEFEPVETEVETMCTPGGCSVKIEQAESDCCLGKYKVTPKIEMPCVPFDIGTPDVSVVGRTGSTTNVNGSVEVEVNHDEPDCCTVKTKVKVVMPNCWEDDIPALPETQITYYNNGVQKKAKLVEWVIDKENCRSYPQITAIDIPQCPLADDSTHGRFNIGLGGYVNWTFSYKNCVPTYTFDSHPGSAPSPCYPTFETTTLDFKWKDSEEEEHKETDWAKIEAVQDPEDPCPKWKITLKPVDLSSITGSGFSSGGDIYLEKDEEEEKTFAYIDGGEKEGDTWYGGGIGDLKLDAPEKVQCRGPIMGAQFGGTTGLIPYDTVETHIMTTTEQSATTWYSQREDGEGIPKGAAQGNLQLVMPTGFQWHSRGIGATLSNFVYNASGVLSREVENGVQTLLAPGISVLTEETTKNASGLAVASSDTATVTHGLTVKNGDGLRLYGVYSTDIDTKDTDDKDNRQGALEIKYGPGFRMYTSKTATEGTYRKYPVTTKGAVTLDIGRGTKLNTDATDANRKNKLELLANSDLDMMFYTTETTDAKKEENAKLCLSTTTGAKTYGLGVEGDGYYPWADEWGRSSLSAPRSTSTKTWTVADDKSEIVIPVVTAVELVQVGTKYVLSPSLAYLHVLQNGTILAAKLVSAYDDPPPKPDEFDIYRTPTNKVLTT